MEFIMVQQQQALAAIWLSQFQVPSWPPLQFISSG
jgi:hypothetical protein